MHSQGVADSHVRPMLEQLEPRLLLSGAPFVGAESIHLVDTAVWLIGHAGSAYGPDGADGWIDPEDGLICHNGMARADILGASGATVTDKIVNDFTVASSGYHTITMHTTVLGGLWSAGDTAIIGGNGGSFEVWLTSRLSGGSLHPHADVEKLYETDVSPVSLLIDLGQQAFDNVVDFYEAVATSGSSLPSQYVLAAVGTIKDLIPDESWPPGQTAYTLETSAYLEAGTTYTWEFGMVSSTIASCIGLGAQTCMTDFTLQLDDVEITLTGGTPPQIDSFFHYGIPYPVTQGGQLLLSTSATDPDGVVELVEYYCDTNHNGDLDIGQDEYVGSDSSPQGGQWEWLGEAKWSPGTYAFFARARDNDGLWSDVATTTVTITSSPAVPGSDLSISGQGWDDDTANGDDDGVMEAGESVRLTVRLQSASGAQNVNAVLTASNLGVDITDPDVYYEDFAPGESQWSVGWFDMYLDFSDHRTSDFTLHVTYELGGQEYYQDLPSFGKTFYVDGEISADFGVIGVGIDDAWSILRYRNDGHGDFQSGEEVDIRPLLENTGNTDATHIDVELYYYGSGESPVAIFGGPLRYPDLAPGQSSYPENEEFFTVDSADWSFTGPVDIGIRVDWYGNNDPDPIERPDAFLTVEPAPILAVVHPRDWDFGVVGPGEDVSYTMRVRNDGSGDLIVTDIQTSDVDTSVPPADRAFTLTAGDYRDVEVTIDTIAIPEGSTISRTVVVVSEAGLGDDSPPSNQLVITGLVCSEIPFYEVLGPVANSGTDVSGNLVVWEEAGDIFAYDLASGVQYDICTDPAGQRKPRISGNLIAWEDSRNSIDQSDIYAFYFPAGDPAEGQEIEVSTNAAYEDLVGVDGGSIAFTRVYYEYLVPYNGPRNLYLYDVEADTTTPITTFSIGGQEDTVYRWDSDFGDGLLTWIQATYVPPNMQTNPRIIKLQVGVDPSPVQIDSGFWPARGPVANDGKIVWSREDGNGREQIWVWQGASPVQLDLGGRNYGDTYLAVGDGMVVYDESGSGREPGLFGYELAGGQTHWVFDIEVNSLRMDDHLAVWTASGNLYYAFLNQADLSITPADITFSDPQPTEGDTIDVTVTVHNVNLWDATGDVTVSLHDGDPDAGGAPWGSCEVISGILARGEDSVVFSGLLVPVGWDPTRDIYARVSLQSGDNPANNKAYKALDVQDSDTQGPVIGPVVIAEYDGDGDSVIGADEQIQISWGLTDPSGIGSTQLWVDMDGDGLGTPEARDLDDEVPLGGDYWATFGPLSPGEYDYAIDATDADNSPASSQYTGTFAVVPAEEITVLYDGQPLVDGVGEIVVGIRAQGSSPVPHIFIVRNDGEQALSLGAITVPAGFIVTPPADTVLPPGGSTHFTVKLDTANLGDFGGLVSLSNSDGDENPFDIIVSGSVRLGGDANEDDCVDGLDYVIWSNNYELFVGGKTWQDGDSTRDGIVDGLDYVVWSNHYEEGCPGVPSAAAEPSKLEPMSEPAHGVVRQPFAAAASVGSSHLDGALTRSGHAAARNAMRGEFNPVFAHAEPVSNAENWRLRPARAVNESGKLEVPLAPAGDGSAPAVSFASLRPVAAPEFVADVEPVSLRRMWVAGRHSTGRPALTFEDDFVDILGLVQLEAPLQA